ncbi:MAG: hypothetical protein GY710_02780 [Desulfobacteraceae bacterium]|nr:hypothetical protein [Desulfobacteraceae bacterium]
MKTALKNKWIYCLIITLMILSGSPGQAVEGNYQSQTQSNNKQIIKLNLLKPIKQKTTTDADSAFINLSQEAIKIGLSDAQLYGRIEQKQLPDKTTRMIIKWHAIGIPTTGNKNLVDTLDSPLSSQFRTTDEQVEPGSIISATGDLQSLIDKFLELKERAKTESPKQVFKEDDDDDENEDRSDNAGDYGSAGSTTAAGGSSGENPLLNDSTAELNENKTSSSYEDCEPRVSTADGVIYRQARQIETGEDGSVANVGECVDQGSAPIQKIWNECPMIFDFANRKAYEQYSEFAQLDGDKIMVTNCTNDFSKAHTIYAKKSNCTTRHDLDAGQSYPQEKLFYTDSSGLEQVLTDCIDANKSYTIFMSSITCSPKVDQKTKTVTVYKRPAFYLDNGTIEYAGACQAVEQKDIQKVYEGCPIIYDYDDKKVYEQYRDFVVIGVCQASCRLFLKRFLSFTAKSPHEFRRVIEAHSHP